MSGGGGGRERGDVNHDLKLQSALIFLEGLTITSAGGHTSAVLLPYLTDRAMGAELGGQTHREPSCSITY